MSLASNIELTPAELNAVGYFLVTLSSVGNPDRDQDRYISSEQICS